MPFVKGTSGNKAGRPKGIIDSRMKLRELIQPHAPVLIQRILTAALAGDMTAAQILMNRCCPSLKAITEAAPVAVDLTGSPIEQSKAILAAVSDGLISIDEATQLLAGIANHMKIIEATDLEARLSAIEAQQGDRP